MNATDAVAALQLLGLTPKLVKRLIAERDILNFTGKMWREPVRPHHHSRSVLQDVFVRLHGVLYSAKLLPLSQFGEGRGHGTKSFQHDVVARSGLSLFVREFASLVPENARCMEWDTLYYVNMMPRCNLHRAAAYHYDHKRLRLDATFDRAKNRTRTNVLGDITRMDARQRTALGGLAQLDVVVCTQVSLWTARARSRSAHRTP